MDNPRETGFKITPAIKEQIIRIIDERVEEVRFTVKDFSELKAIVKDLAEAQKAAEVRWIKSEERLIKLEVVVRELAESHKAAEGRLAKLEVVVHELAEAQKETTKELKLLIGEHQKTREQVGGLSATVGYILEDRAFAALPQLLKRDYGIVTKEKLKRKFVTDYQGEDIEVNIIGEASQNSKEIVIIGESKSQLSKKGVNEFVRKKLKRLEGVFSNIFPILVTHMITSPDVENYAKEKGIALYYSYDFSSTF